MSRLLILALLKRSWAVVTVDFMAMDGKRPMPESITTKCHNESDQKPKAVIAAIRRRLRLTPDDDVSDKEFYGK